MNQYRQEIQRGYEAAGIPGTTNEERVRVMRAAASKVKRLRYRYGPDIEPADPFVRGYSRMYYMNIRNEPCRYCGGPAGTTDHVTPLSKGGKHVWTNFAPACSDCNVIKGNDVPR